MDNQRIRETSVFTLILFYLLLATGCDLTNSNSDEQQRVPGILTSTFSETDSLGASFSVIDSFKVSQPPAVSLNQTLELNVDPEQVGAATLRLEGTSASSNIVVFFFGVNPQNGQILKSGSALTPSSNLYIGTARPDQLTTDIKLHAFFVEGMGAIPANPITLIVEPVDDSAENIELELDPKQHTLPAHYVMHIDEKDIGALPPSWQAEVQLTNEEATELQNEDPYMLVANRQHIDDRNDWNGSIVRGGISSGYINKRKTTDFEFVVMVLN